RRSRHTTSKRDWSSDVCSSDLGWSSPSVVPLDPRAAPPVPVEPVDLVADRNGRDPTTGGPSMTRRERSAFTGPNRTGEQRLSFQPKLVRRDLTVARVEDITPRYRRIVLTGEVLAEGYPFVRFACNDHVKAYFPDPRTGHIVA